MKCNEIMPYFKDKNAIAMSCSDEYVPYLSVYLMSMKEHGSKNNFYDIIIFENSITDRRKEELIDLFDSDNFKIRFFNPEIMFQNVNLYISHSYFKKECYYRIAAPIVLKKYKKLIFTDIDLIVKDDIYNLFNISLNGKVLAAVKEQMWRELYDDNRIIAGQNIRYYTDMVLKLKKPYNYFNTGVLVVDILKYNRLDSFNGILELIKHTNFIYQEQCALNYFFKGKIHPLSEEWNFEFADSIVKLKKEYYKEYLKKLPQAKILHFLGGKKPWFYANTEYNELWWQYAKFSPFYEECLWRMKGLETIHINKAISVKIDSDLNLLRQEFAKVHFPNINNRFGAGEYNAKLSFVMNHLLHFRLKKFGYALKKAFAFGERYAKYNDKYQKTKQLIKDAKKLRKSYYKV